MTVLVIILSIPCLVTLLTYTLYCYEETNRTGQTLPHYLKLSGATIIRSILSETTLLFLHPMGLLPELWRAPSHSDRPLVILVHGLFHNPSAWAVFRPALHRQGFATMCLRYSSWSGEFKDAAQYVRQEIQKAIMTDPRRPVFLVGHSLGGLLIRAALVGIDTYSQVQGVVTLGTPYGGSKLAPFALSSLGRFLHYDGPTVRQLHASPDLDGIRGLALKSPVDNMVLPNSALDCPVRSWKEKTTRPVSHVAMLFTLDIINDVITFFHEQPIKPM